MTGDTSATLAGRVPVREDLAELTPYGAPQLDAPVRLNTNETPWPPPPAYEEALRARLASLDLHRYPDRRVTELRRRLGEREGLPPEQVWAANGSNEVLLQLFLAYGGPGRRLLLFRPGYSAHPLIARVAATGVVEADLDQHLRLTPDLARAAVAQHDPDLVVVSHPNNPTGLPVDSEAIRVLHDAGRALVIVDEAYVEFGATSVRPQLDLLERLVVTRTFSKALRLAGLRLGYLFAPDWVIDDLRRVRLPYHLDTLKQVAALTALELGGALTEHIPRIVAERERLAAALAARPGLVVWPSVGNFLLVRSELPELFDRLLEHGVLVRDFATRPRLEGCVRITVGTPEEDDRLMAAIDAVLAAPRGS